ncbi:MAG: hypothetical protein AAF184_01680 [Pseudomonadota bacterium]
MAVSGSCDTTTADAEATLAIGRVDALSGEGNVVWVLGQKIRFGTNALATLSIGDLVRVEGFPIGEGVAYATSVTRCASQYVAGATKVFLRSVVSAIDHSVGSATAGRIQLSIAAADSDTDITPFAVVSITGTQPAIGGIVLAETAF